jgi:type I restriction enzyme S subunit
MKKALTDLQLKKYEHSPLPPGWITTQLNTISEIILGQSPPSLTYNKKKEGLPFYQGKLEFGDIYPTPRIWCNSPKKVAEKGDVLISVRAPVGPTNICQEKSCIGRGLAAIRPLGSISSFFLLYLLRAYEGDIAGKSTGTTFGAITGDKLKMLELCLPPLNEQKRIVSKLEELFTKLDAGIEALKKTQLLLKQYRQSVLKYAFEGKLTETWRKKYHGELKPVSLTLTKNLERKKEKGMDLSKLPNLPDSWQWTTINDLADDSNNAIKAGPFGSSLKKEIYSTRGYKIYGQEQVIRGDPYYGHYYINKKHYESLKSCSVKPNDVLISLVGTIGKSLILPEDAEPGIINPRIVKISFNNRLIKPSYFKYYLDSNSVKELFSIVSHGGTMKILNLTILKELPIPLPPISEQEKLLKKIDFLLSKAENLNDVIEENKTYSLRLKESILKNSFAGRLVAQDPNDEPAEILIQRIKNTRSEFEGKFDSKKNKSKLDFKQSRSIR